VPSDQCARYALGRHQRHDLVRHRIAPDLRGIRHPPFLRRQPPREMHGRVEAVARNAHCGLTAPQIEIRNLNHDLTDDGDLSRAFCSHVQHLHSGVGASADAAREPLRA